MAERSEGRFRHLIIFALVALAGTAILFLTRSEPALSMKNVTVERTIAILTAMLVIALFLERALAVLVDFVIPPPTAARLRMAFGDKPLEKDAQAVAEAEKERDRFRFVAGYLVGLLVSLAGVRALAGLFEASAEGVNYLTTAQSFQSSLFAFIDLHVTALLLAGGSAGIAAIIAYLRNRAALAMRHLRKTGE